MLLLRDMKVRKAMGMFYTMVFTDRGEDGWILERPMHEQLVEYQRPGARINSGEKARRTADYNSFQRSISLNLHETEPGGIVHRLTEGVVAQKHIGQALTGLDYSVDEVDGLCRRRGVE